MAQSKRIAADTQVTLDIHSDAVPDADWVLLSVDGTSALSSLFDYKLRIASPHDDLKIEDILAQPVKASIDFGGHIESISGVFEEFGLVEASEGRALYEGKLRPKLWLLSLPRHNQVFQDKTVREIVAEVL